MAAIGDVARLAGVSKATASRALSGRGHVAESTRHRVEVAAAEIGYIASPAAASLVTGRTMNVGVVIPFVNRWFFGEVLEGIERALLAAGYDLTLYNVGSVGQDRDRVFDFFLARKRVDAVIAVGVDLTERETAALDRREKPLVSLGGSGAGGARLSIDDHAAGALATQHLLHLGHTRIAHLAGEGASTNPESVHGCRREGFLEAMAAAGLASEADPHIVEAEASMPGGYTGALQLLGHPGRRPSAVFASTDEMAFGAIRAAERLGLSVPGDLSVIGVDGHEYADMFGLTTIEQFPGEQGRLAVDVVLHLLGEDLADPLPDSGAPLPTRLVVRSSTTTAPR